MKLHQAEKRRFMRHPIHVPLAIHELAQKTDAAAESLNISQGGLSFFWNEPLRKGRAIEISIPVKEKTFRIKAKVVYSQKDKKNGLFRTGAFFVDFASAFKAKLAEEALEIIDYQKKLSEETGREVTEEEAARHWIQRFAQIFPKTE